MSQTMSTPSVSDPSEQSAPTEQQAAARSEPANLAHLTPQLDPEADDQQLLEQVVLWYHRCLLTHAPAQEFLHARGLVHPRLLEHFQIGYAPRQLHKLLPVAQVTAGYQLRSRLQQVGVLRPSGHGQFIGCLTLPIRAADGRIADIVGVRSAQTRSRGTAHRAWLSAHHRPCASQRGIFHRAALAEADTLLVADSPLNCLALWCAGLEHTTCLVPEDAAEASAELLESLEPSGVRRLVLVGRNTAAGVAWAEQLAVAFRAAGLQVASTLLPAGRDANDVLREDGPARLTMLTEQAVDQLPRAARRTHTANVSAATEPTKGSVAPDPPPPVAASAAAQNNGDGKDNLAESHAPSGDILLTCDDRHYRVRGLAENTTLQRMKVQLRVTRDELTFVNHVDLYAATQRRQFIREASEELYVADDLLKRDLGRLLNELEPRHEALLQTLETPREPPPVVVPEHERAEALELLRDPRLLERIGQDFETCGLVGETHNRLLCYLACVSRLLPTPLAVLVQSSSAAGKTTLLETTLRLMPPEQQVRYSALTGQSLYYMGTRNLRHKILSIAEEEGVAQAAYALKLLQSDGRLSIAAAGKDGGTGRQQTQEYTVEGPVMMLLTTTAERPDAELASRCLLLQVSESAEQTRAIQARQRAAYTLTRQLREAEVQRVRQRHQNAQRLLEPLPVVLPWAERLSFRADQVRMRRDQARYLTLIAAAALLHQYQRQRVTQGDGPTCLVAEAADVAVANELMTLTLGQSLEELLPQTRQLLVLLDDYVTQKSRQLGVARRCVRVQQRELREALGWGDFALRRHLARLVELEFVLVYRTSRGNAREYELLFDGQGRDGRRFVLGLTAAEELARQEYAAAGTSSKG